MAAQAERQEYTKDGYDRLVAQLEDIERRLAEARLSLGGAADSDSNTWHDNPAFEQTNELIRRLEADRTRVKERLAQAVVVEAQPAPTCVTVGSRVGVVFEGSAIPENFHISGRHIAPKQVAVTDDEADEVEISSSSPLGKSLMGHGINDTVSYRTPSGSTMRLTVVSIS